MFASGQFLPGWPVAAKCAVTGDHWRMARRYLAVAVTVLTLAALGGGAAWLLLYPAVSCVAVAFAYRSNRPELLPKNPRGGRWRSTLLFAPYLLGAWCSWRRYAMTVDAWHSITPRLLLGRRLLAREATELKLAGVSAVLDLAPELPKSRGLDALEYRHVPMLDRVAPSVAQLITALEFIDGQPAGKLLIHCALGYSRSAMVMAAYLIRQGQPVSRALALIRAERSGIVLTDGMLAVLRAFERETRPFALMAGSKPHSFVVH
jgi:protein-tyrosine phosphatase